MDTKSFVVTLSSNFHCRLLINGNEHLILPNEVMSLTARDSYGVASIIVELVEPVEVR